jgi:multiple sugar transport system substrate-binding protein
MNTARKRMGVTVVALAAASMLALSGCSAAAPKSTGPVTISVWSRENAKVIAEQAKIFNSEQKKVIVKVTFIPDAQLLTKFATAIRTGDAPDAVNFDIIDGPLLSTQKTLVDITSRFNALPDKASIVKAGVETGQLAGKQYSLPVGVGSSAMFWNKELFKKAGLDPDKAPSTLDEVLADAKKIKALGNGVYGFTPCCGSAQAYTGYPSIWAAGGDVMSKLGPNQKVKFDTPEAKKVLEWYRDAWNSGVIQPTDAPNADPGGLSLQNWSTGKVGIIFAGSWAISNPDAKKLDWGFAPGIPGFTAGKYSGFVGGQNAGISATSKNVDASWTFLKWLVTSRSAAKYIVDSGNGVPADLTLAKELAAGNALALSDLGAVQVGHAPASIAYSAVVNDANGPWAKSSQAVIFNGANVDVELKKAQDEGDKLIADAYAQLK